MTPILDKHERRVERRNKKRQQIADDLQTTLLTWQSMKHKMFQEWEEAGVKRKFEATDDYSKIPIGVSRYRKLYGPGKSVKPFISGEVLQPLEPAKLKKDVKLTLKDVNLEFKEPVVSLAMQKSLRVLELRLDTQGYLYSPKTFDPNWSWQSQAVWLRTIGIGYKDISERVKKSLNTVKSMFKRLNITKFFSRISKYDYATIGYGHKETPSGWVSILYGGSSGILHPSDDATIDEKSGSVTPLYKAKFSIGETIGKEYTLETEPFSLKKHAKDIKKRFVEDKKYREQITLEQKSIEIENLKKNVDQGFDPDTGTYLEEV